MVPAACATPKSTSFTSPSGVTIDVLRPHVEMGQSPRVQVIERRGKTLQQRHDLLRSEGSAHRDLFAQGAALDALQHEPRRATLLAEGESADHIGMRQELQQASLATEARPHLGIAPVLEAQRLHDHRVARPQVATFVRHRDAGARRWGLQIDRIAAGNGDARVRRVDRDRPAELSCGSCSGAGSSPLGGVPARSSSTASITRKDCAG